MKMTSEFESLYHALVYHVHHLIKTDQKTWRSLSDALNTYCDDMDFELPQAFEDALLDDSHDAFFELFHSENDSYSTLLGDLPPVNYSVIEKHYLKWLINHEQIGLFLSPATQLKLKEALSELPESIFDGRFININKQNTTFDQADKCHLNLAIDAIENGKCLHYHYMDDEGKKYICDTQPLFIEYNFQIDLIYLVHLPIDSDVPIKGLLSRFEQIEIIEPITSSRSSESILEDWRKPIETIVLSISKTCPHLRKVLVELSVFERIIMPNDDHYTIHVPIYPQEALKIKTKVASLVPNVTVVSPPSFRESLKASFKDALQKLELMDTLK